MGEFEQNEKGWMVYPRRGWRRLLFKMPLVGWRLGLGPLLGHTFLVLTTTGRRSGLPRHTMLEYSRFDGRVYVASGWGERTDWYRNIVADPHVTIQTAAATERVVARRVNDDETLSRLYDHAQRSPVWESYLASFGIQPTRADFLAKKDRLLILTFDPTAGATPPPLQADLTWVWLLPAGCLLVGWCIRRRPRPGSRA